MHHPEGEIQEKEDTQQEMITTQDTATITGNTIILKSRRSMVSREGGREREGTATGYQMKQDS